MTKSLCLAVVVMASTLSVAGASTAEESEAALSHPADLVAVPSGPVTNNAFDLAVPMIDRPDAHPSYGPAPAGGSVDPVEHMDQMMEMDHSQHQMPETNQGEMPQMDHSQHQMPGVTHDAPPENPQ